MLIFVPVNEGEAAICLAHLRHVFRFIMHLTDALSVVTLFEFFQNIVKIVHKRKLDIFFRERLFVKISTLLTKPLGTKCLTLLA